MRQGYFCLRLQEIWHCHHFAFALWPKPIHAPYLISEGDANFVACHQFSFLERFDMLKYAAPGGIFLLNSHLLNQKKYGITCRRKSRRTSFDKKLKFYVIDGYEVAQKTGMGSRVNTIMQTCFFAISGVLPRDEAIAQIKKSIKKTYGKRGEAVVQQNFEAVDHSLANLKEVKVPAKVTSSFHPHAPVSAKAPEFVKMFLAR